MDKNYFLKEGPQTEFTPLVKEYAEKAREIDLKANVEEAMVPIYKTSKFISQLPRIEGYIKDAQREEDRESNKRLKDKIFRKRTLNQILQEGFYPTCSDIGVLFRGLMVAQGIPSAYVETFHEDYLLDKAFSTHAFVRVFTEDSSVLVDPSGPKIAHSEKKILPYVIFKEGLDSWDIGIRDYEDLHQFKDECKDELLCKLELLKEGEPTTCQLTIN